MATLDGALRTPNSQSDRHKWHYERSLKRTYTEKFIAGLIGEKEGRKWLKEQGYEVFEFGMVEHYFEEAKETSERLAKRRKQAYVKQDKIQIKYFEDRLREFFGDRFEDAKSFFFEFLPKRREIWRLRRKGQTGISPDFIVKKGEALSLIEVKANTSKPTIFQNLCFEMGKKFGINSMVLNVTVQSRMVKEMKLLEY
jgi:hypothetical protein